MRKNISNNASQNLCPTLTLVSDAENILHRVSGLSPTYRVRSSEIQRELGVEPRLGGEPGADPESNEELSVSSGLEHLRIPQEELDNMTEERDVWVPLVRLPP